ncbi:membrane-spanning 4-domains subfamily A member 4A-like isoform X3 [Chlorella sorokiniana]|uniref:Membrane-spanning 4-domains subfamily A member 4A-like isoform X3 n=1 Tax=Chlorella sorokiniana TaxID=3076 RepID=A0A2P6TMF6_CHLSO|nr:membrane-spanning 4-domains subfamily A member 4A-like isoform X3 [Chlorella sorokiniana]|eukprot:PRW45518.1 membrane-spanning 4-domains subfamily A member 4A-like isoform X3 [Chlorella sorokiniana]
MGRGVPGANPFGPLYMLSSVLSIGLCIAILVIVNQQLWEYFYAYVSGSSSYYYNSWSTCYMQSPNNSGNLCYYSWAAAGVGLFFALWLLFIQICSGRSRHIPVCEVLVCVLATCWWIAAATTATVYGKDANSWAADNINSTNSQNQQYAVQLQDKEGYRTSVWAMGWANVGLFALTAILSLFDCCKTRKNPPPVAQNYPQGAYVSSQPPPYQPAYQAPYYAAGPPPGAYAAPPAGAYAAPPAGAYAAPPSGYPPAAGTPAPAGYPPTT